jgi:hypothetical protein
MKRTVRHAIRLLRASAAECGYPLDHLMDAELLAGVASVYQSFEKSGEGTALLSAAHRHLGLAFSDLWLAALEPQKALLPRLLTPLFLDEDTASWRR